MRIMDDKRCLLTLPLQLHGFRAGVLVVDRSVALKEPDWGFGF